MPPGGQGLGQGAQGLGHGAQRPGRAGGYLCLVDIERLLDTQLDLIEDCLHLQMHRDTLERSRQRHHLLILRYK